MRRYINLPPAAAAAAAAVMMLAAGPARADTVVIGALKDNTMYREGSLSNGMGQHIFAGMTNTQVPRRALLAFDVASSIPAGSTIQSAALTLNMSLTIAPAVNVSLHRVTTDWGEGASAAFPPEGAGGPAAPGDATWLHTFFDTAFWTNSGGDFVAAASATTSVAGLGVYAWSSAAMAADVQDWLDSPASNFGWIVIGDESIFPTAKRFDSRQNIDPALHPGLRLEFTPPGAGSVPDGASVPGIPLTVSPLPGGDIFLRWSASCLATDTDFAVYEGTLGVFTSHVPRTCTTGGATVFTLTPAAASSYYLVVPRNAAREGSYGLTSNLLERPPSTAACLPQALAGCS